MQAQGARLVYLRVWRLASAAAATDWMVDA
jgi:hypothetical protein